MKIHNSAEFLSCGLEPGSAVYDRYGNKWLVVDKISHHVKGSGLIRVRDGLYLHALHLTIYPLYTGYWQRKLDRFIGWIKQRNPVYRRSV